MFTTQCSAYCPPPCSSRHVSTQYCSVLAMPCGSVSAVLGRCVPVFPTPRPSWTPAALPGHCRGSAGALSTRALLLGVFVSVSNANALATVSGSLTLATGGRANGRSLFCFKYQYLILNNINLSSEQFARLYTTTLHQTTK